MGGNIGTADPVAGAAAHWAASMCIEMSSYQIDLAPSLDPTVGILLNVTEDHLDRHGTLENYAAVKERLVGRRAARRHRDRSASTTAIRRAAADRIERAGKTRGARLGAGAAARRLLCRARAHRARRRRQARTRDRAARRHRLVARPAQRAERGLRGGAARSRSGSICRRSAERPAQLSRPRAPHGAGRPHAAACCSSTTPRATNADAAAQGAGVSFDDIFWIAGGKPKTGGIDQPRRILPAHPQGLSDRRGGAGIRRDARTARCRTRSAARSTAAVDAAARDAEASGLQGAGGAAVAGLRLVRPVPQFRNARRTRSATWCWRSRGCRSPVATKR